MDNYELYHGDCLEIMQKLIDDGVKVDMVLTDPPYGTTACKWDSVIPFDKMWEKLNLLIKDNGAIVLTASQPFTSLLVNSNIKDFKYEWIYKKVTGSNFAVLKYQPMKEHENVLVFSKNTHFYNPIKEERGGNEKGKTRKPTRKESLYTVYSEGVYGAIKSDRDTREYGELRNPSSVQTFNNRKPSDRGLHPTQKPLELMEYLIKTYTNEGETVLDNCMGSGTTGVACKKIGRHFIGIEKEKQYFDIAQKRISEASKVTNLFNTEEIITEQLCLS